MQNNAHHSSVRYELIDTNIAAILKVGLFFIISGIISPFFFNAMYFHFLPKRVSVPLSQRPDIEKRQLANEPKLQPSSEMLKNPPEDMKEWRKKEESYLSSYGWVNQDKGVVRIPIEEAIKIMNEKGFLVKVSTVGAPALGIGMEKIVTTAADSQSISSPSEKKKTSDATETEINK